MKPFNSPTITAPPKPLEYSKGDFVMAYLKGKTLVKLCIYCNAIYLYGEWRNVDEIDQKFMPLEIKNTICQNCSFERFPKFYMNKNTSKGKRTKRSASKFFFFFKRYLHRFRSLAT